MRKLIFIIIPLFLISCNTNQKSIVKNDTPIETITTTPKDTATVMQNSATVKNDLYRNNLNGKVKSVTLLIKSVYSDAGTEEPELKLVTFFNEHGSETEEDTYNADGSLYQKQIIKDNSKGNRIAASSYDGGGNLTEALTFKYDSRDNLIEMISSRPDGGVENKATCTYDNNANITEQKFFDGSGNYLSKQTFKYDSKGNPAEQNSYTDKDSLDSHYTFKYDSNKNPVEQVGYPEKDVPIEKLKFEFSNNDKNSNWQHEIEYRNGSKYKVSERVIEYY